MRIITLNTWGGWAGREKVLDFFRKHVATTDIFCLQEIWSAPYTHLDGVKVAGRKLAQHEIMIYGLQDLCSILPDFVPFFRPLYMDHFGNLMMVHKKHRIIAEGEVYIYKHKGYLPEGEQARHARNMQYVTLLNDGVPLTVMNLHGLWNGQGKYDCEERLEQTQRILDFTQRLNHPHVVCGDFNLRPDTESMERLEMAGLRNLIRDFGITSTRTSLYTKPEQYADYALVSDGIGINHFEVLPDEVSDHAPLLLDAELHPAPVYGSSFKVTSFSPSMSVTPSSSISRRA